MARGSNAPGTNTYSRRLPLGVVALAMAGAVYVAPTAGAQMLNFRQYTAAEGLPQAQVMAMRQDRLGYLWFATYGGVSRFDGSRFVTYTKEDGLSSNAVFDIVDDEHGRMYLATSGGLCIRESERFRCIRQSDGLVNDNARSIALDGRGVWVGTLTGLSYLRDGKIHNYTTASGLPAERVIRVVIDSSGTVWVATPRGIVRREGDRFVRDTLAFPGDTVTQFISPAGDGLLAGVDGHLYLRRSGSVTPVAEGQIPARTAFVDGAVDRHGTIWVATRTGVLRIGDGRVDQIGKTNGLLSDMVLRVMVDREGDVWFGTENGASKHAPGPFRTYTAAEGLPSPFVRDMEIDRQGRLWAGTRNGVAIREGERFRVLPLPGIPDPRIYDIVREPNAGMLIATRRGLVWYREGNPPRVYGEKEGLPGEAAYCLLPDSAGVWVGTERGLARWESGRLTTVGPAEITKPGVISMARDRRGRVWLGRIAGGVAILDGDSVTVIGPEQGASDQTIWDLDLDAQGRMWAATNGDGALRIDERGGVRRFTMRDGLASNFIWQVLGDSKGRVWLFGNQGIDRFAGDTLNHFGRGDGLIDLEGTASAAFEDNEGNLWFGTGVGLLRYSEGPGLVKAIAPPIFIEEATLDDKPIAPVAKDGIARLDRGTVRLSFSSPTFRDESAVRFRYRLVGASDSWSAPTTERSITYAGLAPRRYRFEVIALNGNVRSSVPATMAFEVLPPFWQTWWFRLIGTTVLLGAAAAIPLWRARALDRERRRLEAVIAHHTHELAEKNARLESSNRDLEHFAYVASHDLQEPLRKIQAFSDRVAKQYGPKLDDQGRDYLQRMNGAAARMQRLIDALLSLSRVSTKKKENELIDLAPLVHEVLGDLEVRIQTTGGKVVVGDLPRIEGDPVQIRQLFQNLIGNALKFHKPGEPPVVEVYARRRAPGLSEIFVIDNGIGFAKEEAERVFLPFHRLHGRSEYEGTGIGLTICQKIVERHGGSIRAESTPGKGSRFILSLPTQERIGDRYAA